MPIRILDNQVIDQIAAGEVVERPAHLVKEIVENALDAGANEITVDFKNGGRHVRVDDNGQGIPSGEISLALARHATSKIEKVDDIWRIHSYGFRGEALASIAAVSRMTITSRTKGADSGHRIIAEYGKIGGVQPSGAAFGTSILIEGLFENVPARLKFLKSDTGEAAAIKIQIKALALARPDVAFRIRHDGEFVAYWPTAPTFLKRAAQVLNEEELYEGKAELDGIHVCVAISSPNRTVGNSRQIWTMVQQRYVQDRGMQAAVLDAYRQLLMHGEYPVAAVDLRCDPEFVDVNVSPTKSQVKFQDASQVFRAVHRAVRDVLEKAPWREAVLAPSLAPSLAPVSAAFVYSSKPKAEPEPVPMTLAAQVTQFAISAPVPTSVNANQLSSTWAALEILGQAKLTYILTQSSSAIVIVDQHAAHERVLFERLMKGVRAGSLEVQNFLLPQAVEFSEEIAHELMKASDDFTKLGFVLEMTGPTRIAIQAAPALLPTERLPALIEAIADDYVRHGGSFRLDKALGDVVATMACHSAVRAGQALSIEEMRALLTQMDEFPLSSFCPHGRPVYVEYPFHKLERDFGRIV